MILKTRKCLKKTGFAQIFSRCPKFGEAAAPLAPPARTPMSNYILQTKREI